MRVINEKFETITEYDLTDGSLIPKMAIKENAEPIDNVTKFAWSDEDWEEVQMFVPNRDPDPEPEPEPPVDDSAVWDELDAAYQEGVDSV